MRISIPDDLYDALKARHGTATATEAALVRALEALAKLPRGRTLTLDADQLGALEPILGSGSVLDGADLVRKVRSLAEFTVGHITLDFSASDLNRLRQRAARRDVTLEAYVRCMLDRFKDDWMLIGEPVDLTPAEQT